MENMMKKSLYSGIGILFGVLYSATQVYATNETPVDTFWSNSWTLKTTLESDDLGTAVQNYVIYIMTFLYLIAVLYALWGWFNILTAGGDEEKVKKGKTILIQGWIGLLVIWLSGAIVTWIISMLAA